MIQKEYQLEKEELRNKLIEYNVTGENIDQVFATMDRQNRTIKLLDFIRILKEGGINVSNMVTFLKNLSIDDQIITRIISSWAL